jgi:predicted RNase H-like HicB family nuclease
MKIEFVFTGIIYKDGNSYSSLCPELDVASQGSAPEQAKENLFEAVALYLETALESTLPYLRPIMPADDPRNECPDSITGIFNLKVDLQIKAYA